MARIRTIKPEFCQSESMGRISREARLLFVQMWTLADDAGRLRASSRMLASLLYPYDDDVPGLINAWLSELEDQGCILQYEADNTRYAEICNWLDHQKIDRPSPSKIPSFDEGSPATREVSRSIETEGNGREGIRKRKGMERDASRKIVREEFRVWYEAFPRHVGVGKAEEAYIRVREGGVSAEDLLAGAVRAAAYYAAEGTEQQYIPHPTTWLNQERWLDELTAKKSTRMSDEERNAYRGVK
jgi:hypothetical protein